MYELLEKLELRGYNLTGRVQDDAQRKSCGTNSAAYVGWIDGKQIAVKRTRFSHKDPRAWEVFAKVLYPRYYHALPDKGIYDALEMDS